MFKSHSARKIISMFLLLAFLCVNFFIGLGPVIKADAAVVSFRIKNRFTGDYMNEANKDGKVQYGALNTDLDSMKWVLEDAANDGTGSTRIKNVSSGNYLGIENVTGYVEAGALNPAALSMMWYLKDAGDGCVRLQCVWQDHADYMHIENKLGYVESGPVPEAWLSAQWVLEAVNTTEGFTISPTKVVDNNRGKEANVISPTEITSNYYGVNKTWTQSKDTSSLPQFKAESYPILEALYNMSLEDALKDIRTDGAFKAGESWPGVWTRDISYSSQLSLSWIMPTNAKASLMAKTFTNPDEIIQDTGTGGSWPVSTDRVVWGIAAWEYYLTTGDTAWLNTAYDLLNNTVQKDQHVAFDSNIGLFNGETSLMDWRNQTYPDWFSDLPGGTRTTYENRYIAESKALSTNVLYSQIYSILGQMGTALGKPSTEISNWNSKSSAIKTAINNKFWMDDKGYYGLFLYPRSIGYALSKKSDALGLGLSMYYGVADSSKAVSITQNYPVVDYGVPTIYPEKANHGPYHNKSIWPVVEAYYMLGAKKAGNTQAVEHTMKSFIRASALFLTNKENYVYDTGNSYGTAVNSSSMLWSTAGYLSMVYRVIMGMNYTAEGIEFNPMVPDSFTGPFELLNFKYRDSTLNVKVSGNGDQIDTLTLDGVTQNLPYVYPANGTGSHTIEITLKKSGLNYSINKVQAGVACEAPVEPIMSWTDDGKLQWTEETGYSYKLWDGKNYFDATSPYTVANVYNTYNLVKISDTTGIWSDLGGIAMKIPDGNSTIYEAEDGTYNPDHFANNHVHSGTGFVADANGTADLSITVDIPAGKSGNYILRYWYANSNSEDGNFCGIRSMLIDGVDSATVVFPNLSNGNWDIYNYSSYVFTNLTEGTHTIKLIMSPDGNDQNMSRSKNDMNLDYLELIKQSNTDTTLKDLQVDGKTVTGFAANTTKYEVTVAAGSTTPPAISATVNDSNANLVITQATSVTGSAIVVVTAEDGVTTMTYEVRFTEKTKSTDATLKDFQVDGKPVTDFIATTTTYEVTLPYGTTTVPEVSATVNDPNANTVITQATSVTGSAIVVVTAEDGVTEKTYTVNFIVAPITTPVQNSGGGSVVDTSPISSVESGKEMDSSNLSKLVSNQKTLTVTSNVGNIIFDTKALKAILNNVDQKLKILIEKVDFNKLSDVQKIKVQDRPIYEMTVLSGSEKVTNFGEGIATVSIPYTLKAGEKAENIVIWYLTDDGAVEALECKYDNASKTVTFNTNHFSYYIIGYVDSSKWINPFSDVSEKAWYYDAVKFVNADKLMSGTTKTTFEPNNSTTRAMIVTTLYKYYGEPQVSDKSSFTDVEDNKWYSAAIAWAKKNGIATGNGNDIFNPNGNVTREQLACFFLNYAEYIAGEPIAITQVEPNFKDSNKTSSWAKQAIMFCTQSGIMGGKGNGILDPKGYATRAELSAMLMNFMKYLEK